MGKLDTYIQYFSNLHTNKMKGEKAPHKAILLLSVIDLIVSYKIPTNHIEYTELLEERFYFNWKKYVSETTVFKNPKVGTPYWHMHYEPFWKLVPFIGGEATIANLQKSNPYSSGIIRRNIRYAVIDRELFELLQDKSARELLTDVLIKGVNNILL